MLNDVKNLSEKRTHLRTGVKNFMRTFAEITANIEGISAKVLEHNGYGLYIRTGEKDLYYKIDGYESYSDFDKNYMFYQIFTIHDLRIFCENLPDAIREIQSKIDSELADISKLVAKFEYNGEVYHDDNTLL